MSIVDDYDSIRKGMRPDPFWPISAKTPATSQQAKPLCNIIFFSPKDACVSPAGIDIINEIATHFKKSTHTRIRIEGHTDTFGDAAGNVHLARYRALSVKARLVDAGVPGGVIECIPLGSSMLRVQTGPQVSHTENRRAEVFLL